MHIGSACPVNLAKQKPDLFAGHADMDGHRTRLDFDEKIAVGQSLDENRGIFRFM